MSTAKEFRSQLDTIRQQVINMVASTARCFETYDAAGELSNAVKYAEGYDDQDEPYVANEIELDGTIVVYYHGTETHRLQPKECETDFLLELLEEMETTLAKLHKEFA